MISIIMSVYNDSKYLDKSIESILNQTYKDYEFIIVDDCSTDDSLNIIKKFFRKDNRIKIIENEANLGLAVSLNKAIKKSKGKYIARMDGDDISLPNRLQMQLDFMEQISDIDICGTGLIYIDNKANEIKKVLMASTHNQIKQEICKRSPFAHPSVMIRKRFFHQVGLYDQNLAKKQDYELWVRGLMQGARYANLQEYLILYRYEPVKNFKTDLYEILVRFKIFTLTKNFKCLLYAVAVFNKNMISRLIRRDKAN